jgi:two-component system, NtrC family, sensor kinase
VRKLLAILHLISLFILISPLCSQSIKNTKNNDNTGTRKIKAKTDSINPITNIHYIFGKSLNKNTVKLNEGWKYINKNDSLVAKKNFIDNAYPTIRINKSLDSFDLTVPKYVWFRKIIHIDSVFLDCITQLSVRVNGAAEVYLDNHLLIQIGEFKKNLSEVNIHTSSTPYFQTLMFRDTGLHVIAIKYVLPDRSCVNISDEQIALNLAIVTENDILSETYHEIHAHGKKTGISGAVYMMMALIHFFFYYLFRSQKFNLHFCIAMVLFSIYFLLNTKYQEHTSYTAYNYKLYFREIIFHIAHLVMLATTYEYVDFPKRKLFWSMIVIWVVTSILEYVGILPGYSMPLLFLLVLLNYLYIINKSSKQNNMHGFIVQRALLYFIVIFFIFMMLLTILFLTKYFYNFDFDQNNAIVLIFGFMILLGPPLLLSGSITFSLAKEHIRVADGLKLKIKEVENLAVEKEMLMKNQNTFLEEKVALRTQELNASVEEVKRTQKQLIQSEKMASLGELTAGIAHEIKNPLNFVNNFSEVNAELIEELITEVEKGNGDEIKEISNQIKENLKKISNHGKRADNIVKSMLEHSRNSSGKKDLIDINQLIEEYVNLAFHGLRAKDKTFNSALNFDLSKEISKINVIPQDIGRVILNLVTNAFHAVTERKKKSDEADIKFDPTVSISTFQSEDETIIEINDNGVGISQENIDKIFQPFFTTKPTGQGTGLGLSLTYDIIQAHDGKIEVVSKLNEGTSFILKLPCN